MIKTLIFQFDLHQKLFNNVLAGLTDAETNQRVHGNKNMNPMKYLAGHLLNTQYAISAMAGIKNEVKWNDLFAPVGQSIAKDDFEYPAIEEIVSEWNQIYPAIRQGLERLTVADLEVKPPGNFDKIWGTCGDMWAFLNHHQAYHIGQIGILRRGHGKEPMSYE